MKSTRIFTTILLILALFNGQKALATAPEEPQSTTVQLGDYTYNVDVDGNVLLEDKAGWDNLAEVVADGNDCAGLNFKMTANIGTAEEPVTKPLGRQVGTKKTQRNRFAGTFDGAGHTLTIAMNTSDDWFNYNKGYCAPFAYVKNTTIRNLTVTGTITSAGQFASGLVGSSGNNTGDGAITIEKCHVSVAMSSSYKNNNNYPNHAGFLSIAEGSATITDCWFDGSMTGNFQQSGGFIGLNKAPSTLKNCLFNPVSLDGIDDAKASEFIHNSGNRVNSFTKCYWTVLFGDENNVQGDRVFVDQTAGSTAVTAADGQQYYLVANSSDWTALGEALAAGGTVTMSDDVVACTNDEPLVIPAGTTVTLDLAGHAIDRALTSAREDGNVIKVEAGASLTITGNGTIKGGNNTGNAGGIWCQGTLSMSGVTVTGNTASGFGGGIFLDPADASTVYTFNNCSISGNKTTTLTGKSQGAGLYVGGGDVTLTGCALDSNNGANQGAGIYVTGGDVKVIGGTISDNYSYAIACGAGLFLNGGTLLLDGTTVTGNTGNKGNTNYGVGAYIYDGTFQVKGNVQINGNTCTKSKTSQDVHLQEGKVITIAGPLGSARIGVEGAGVITDGLRGNGSAGNFFSDVAGKMIIQNSDGEAEMFFSTLYANLATLAGQTKYWTTFYHPSQAYALPAGVRAFMLGSDHALCLVGEGDVIPADCAVILMSDSDSITLSTSDVTVPDSEKAVNILRGTSVATEVTDLPGYTAGETTVYVLSNGSDGLGFFEFSGTTLAAGKAYYLKQNNLK